MAKVAISHRGVAAVARPPDAMSARPAAPVAPRRLKQFGLHDHVDHVVRRHRRARAGAAKGKPYPNKCASQYAAPAARPPTNSVCNADFTLLAPVKCPLIAPKHSKAVPVTATEISKAAVMLCTSI